MSFEDTKAYQCGRWFNAYVKIYTLGGDQRIVDLSNYPRAYEDVERHCYTEDVEFIVGSEHVDKKGEYVDSKSNVFKIGDIATHWIGDLLPGAYPKWIPSEGLMGGGGDPMDHFDDLPWELDKVIQIETFGDDGRKIIRLKCRRVLRE